MGRGTIILFRTQFNHYSVSLRSIPFVRFFVPFAAGTVGGEFWGTPWHLWPLVIVGLALLLILFAFHKVEFRWRWWFGLWAFLSLFALGWLRTANFAEYHAADHFSKTQGSNRLIGVVDEAPEPGNWWKMVVRVEAAGCGPDSLNTASGRLIVFFKPDSAAPTLQYGDRLALAGTFSPCEGPKNPHSFDYRWYLHTKNIHFQMFARSDSIRIIARKNGTWFWRTAYQCRDRILVRLKTYFTTPNEYAVACALLLGYQADLSDEVRTIYVETGSMHALAVSGTHVGMVYAGLLMLLRRLPVRGVSKRMLQTTAVLLGIWAFTLITGASASVLRAALMFSLFLAGRAIFRQASVWNILAASAFLLVVYSPYFLFDAGGQLSYCAVAGMVFFFPRLYKISPIFPKWIDAGWQVLLVGIAAQLGTLPLSIYYFHQFPVYFWLAGWVVVLGGAIFLWGGAALVLLDLLWPMAANWLGLALYFLVKYMNLAVGLIQQLPGSVWGSLWMAKWGAVACSTVLVLFAAAWAKRSANLLYACLILWSLTGLVRLFRSEGRLSHREITVYSVSKNRLIDFFNGEKIITLCDSSISTKQEKFAAEGHRVAWGMRQQEKLDFLQPAWEKDSIFFRKDPICIFYNIRLAILDDPLWLRNPNYLFPVDYLILSKNCASDLSSIIKVFPCTTILADGTNSFKNIQKWKKEALELGLFFHDTSKKGAFQISIN